MAHGGHGKRREAGKPARSGNKGLAVQQSDKKNQKKSKMASIKNQMRSIRRLLQKNLSAEMKDAQQKHLEDLKRQAEQNQRAELERKMSLRYRRVKFFERRKIERAIKRLEKLQEAGSDDLESAAMTHKLTITEQLAQLKEDLEYVRFFPKTEKYVSLLLGHDDEEVIAKRSKLREQIKANLAAAAAAGVEPEEMEIDEDQAMEVIDDDFFLAGSSSDDAEADDKRTLTSSKPGAFKDHTAKKLPASSSRCSLGQKHHQQHQRPLKSPSSSQLRNQRPQSTGSKYKNKGSQFCDERHQSQIGSNKNKKQKTTMNPPPLSPSPSYSRSQPASNNTFKIASCVLPSNNNTGLSNAPSSRINSDIVKVLPVDSSNMDVQKKRRRKHRPKKKKS